MNDRKKLALIFGNGPFAAPAGIDEYRDHADCIIAADGGANHCAYLDIVPDCVIGDLDSIEPQLLKIYENKNTQIKRFPRRKDATDLELALNLAMQEGASDLLLLGVLGKRWDMSLANIMLAASDRFSDLQISLVSNDSIIKILRPRKTHLFLNSKGKTVSFLPLSSDVIKITLDGFSFQLKDENLPFGSTRGISNIIKTAEASEIHESGVLLCIKNI